MTTTIIWTIAILTILGVVLAVVLYFVAEKFKVEEDPRIDEVEKVLPGANCGGCGQAGCRAFAQFCVESSDIEHKLIGKPVSKEPYAKIIERNSCYRHQAYNDFVTDNG